MLRLLNRIGLTNWRRRIIALLIIMPVFGITSVEITSQSRFCNSCHIMEPYYDSWRRGSHKDVECVKCHINPGVTNFLQAKLNGLGQVVDDVLHRTSMKPSASVSQLACMRSGCHDIEKIRATTKTTGLYLFRHDKHMGLEYSGIKVACANCHSHVKGDKHFEVNTNVCVTCHLIKHDGDVTPEQIAGSAKPIIRLAVREGTTTILPASATLAQATPSQASPAPTTPAAPGAAPLATSATPGLASPSHGKLPPDTCTTCHNPPAGVIERGGLKINHAEYLSYGASCESCHRGTTAVPVPVESGQCFECHNFGLERLTSTEDMHRVHNEGEHKIECFSCHGTVHHGPTAQAARLNQFDCRRCHTDQHSVQRNTYLHNDTETLAAGGASVSPMFLAHVDCTGCHIKKRPVSVKPDSGATVAAAVPEACDACHKPGFEAQMVPLWQKTAHGLYDQVAAGLKAAEAAGPGTDVERAKLEEVRKILETVRVDGSWGVHNPRYTQLLLEKAREKLAPAKKDAPQPTEGSK